SDQSRPIRVACVFSPRRGGTLCTLFSPREPMACPVVSPACLAFFRQALKMDPALLPRLKPGPSIRQELREVIELYVECVAGRRLPRRDGLLAAETSSVYRSRVSLARS